MQERPTPVVMVSSLTRKGAEATLRALDLGAADFIEKPTNGGVVAAHMVEGLAEKVRAAASARVRRHVAPTAAAPAPPASAKAAAPRPAARAGTAGWARRIVMIGSSTGGPRRSDS